MTAFSAGQVPTAAELQTATAVGIVPGGYGKRITASSSTTTEVGVLRLDGIAVTLGRQYRISTSPLNMSSTVANDMIDARIRAGTSGVATTTSTQLTGLVETAFTSGGAQRTQGEQVTYTPAASGTLSVLLSIARDTGTGSASINGSALIPIELIVEDCGAAASNTGNSI